MANAQTQVRVNISAVTNAPVRAETRNGRKVVIVPSATLPDNVVMNGIMYPAAEIEKSYRSLERTPAPLGHPTMNGNFISASDPEGINIGYIGAWNENVRRVDGRVFLDKVIDVEVANRTDGGKAVLAALNAKEPIHTSTGLLCMLEPVTNKDGYEYVAKEMTFDHDAILLNEQGAATPDQGVGMLVNGQQLRVINSALDAATCRVDWAGMDLLSAFDGLERATLWEKLKGLLLPLLTGTPPTTTNPEQETTMAQNEPLTEALNKQLGELAASVKALTDALPAMIGNAVKPLTDHIAEVANAQKAAADAEKAALVTKVANANLLSAEVANTLTIPALKELAAKVETKPAAALNAAFGGTALNANDGFDSYDPNKIIDAEVK